jgi:hypothetical protein
MYSTDNGAEVFTWPDGGTTMFAGEKATQWEGGFRVPTAIRWPGVIKPGTVINDIGAHEDMLPTLLAAVGDPNVKEDLLKGKQVGDMTYKVHLDAYNLLPALKGEAEWPRHEFLYWTDDGNVAALRYNDWKITFLRQNAHGMLRWQMAAKLQGLSAAPETRQLQPRSRDGGDHQGCGRQVGIDSPGAVRSLGSVIYFVRIRNWELGIRNAVSALICVICGCLARVHGSLLVRPGIASRCRTIGRGGA